MMVLLFIYLFDLTPNVLPILSFTSVLFFQNLVKLFCFEEKFYQPVTIFMPLKWFHVMIYVYLIANIDNFKKHC